MEKVSTLTLATCVKCGKTSQYNCYVCLQNYCSEECQAADWSAHKTSRRHMLNFEMIYGSDATDSGKSFTDVNSDSATSVVPACVSVHSPQSLPSLNILPSIISTFKEGDRIIAQITGIVSEKSFWVTAIPEHAGEDIHAVSSYSDDLDKIGANATAQQPLEGSYVSAFSEKYEQWFRACVLDADNVIFVDYGDIEKVSKFAPLLENFSRTPALAVLCSLSEMTKPFNEQDNITFEVSEIRETGAKIRVSSFNGDTYLGCGQLFPWKYYLQQQKDEELVEPIHLYQPVSDGDKVVLESYSPLKVFVSLQKKKEEFEAMIKSLTASCFSIPALTAVPAIGEFIGCFRRDTLQFHRAYVRDASSIDSIYVEFIDLGTEATVKSNQLKPLQQDFKTHPRFAVPINLENWPRNLDYNAIKYLDALQEKVLIYSMNPLTEKSILTDEDGNSTAEFFAKRTKESSQ